jgi:hypothetical protein
MRSRNFQYPACRSEALKEQRLETIIQDHVILPMIFTTTSFYPRKTFYAKFRINLMSITANIEKLKPTLGIILAVCFLDVVLNIRYPASDLPLLTLFKLSPEVLGILLVICLTGLLRIRFQAAVYMPLTALVIFLRLFRTGDILVPMYFFRPFNLYLDSRFLPDLIHLLYRTLARSTFILGVSAAAGPFLSNSSWAAAMRLFTASLPIWLTGPASATEQCTMTWKSLPIRLYGPI